MFPPEPHPHGRGKIHYDINTELLLSSTPLITGTSGRDSRLCWLLEDTVRRPLSSLLVKLLASGCGRGKYNG
ncbi:hypothetical protein F7725_024204, partial [Dissostichus mawsoni]